MLWVAGVCRALAGRLFVLIVRKQNEMQIILINGCLSLLQVGWHYYPFCVYAGVCPLVPWFSRIMTE